MGGEDVARRGDSARIQGMVRSIDQYRNGQPKAVADGSYAQVLFALTDYKHDVLVLWDFAVESARKSEALQRENAELREALRPFADVARYFGHLGDDYGSVMVNIDLGSLRRARTIIQGEKNA